MAKKPGAKTQQVMVKKLHSMATIPERQTELASGFDLVALDCLYPNEKKINYEDKPKTWVIYPNERILVRTGIATELTEGLEVQVRPRSGLALKHGITVLNSPGTVDADYRGDVGVILANQGNGPFTIKQGDRIAQLVITPVLHDVEFQEDELSITGRGEQGYGHTDKKDKQLHNLGGQHNEKTSIYYALNCYPKSFHGWSSIRYRPLYRLRS